MAVSRVDSAGDRVDSHMRWMQANGQVEAFKGVSKGGDFTEADVLSAPATGTVTWGDDQVSVGFTSVTGAQRYLAEAWLNTTPGTKKVQVGTASPLVITGLTAGASSARVRALGDTGREDGFVQSDWSTTATGTVT